MNMIKNPLFKIIGVIAIIYLGLFNNTEKKDSLGNRITTERIKENLGYIKDKSVYIKENLKNSKEYEATENQQINQKNQAHRDLLIGIGEGAKCGDFVLANIVKLENNAVIEDSRNEKLKISKTKFYDKFIGMKKGGKRSILIQELIENQAKDFIYEIELVDVLNKNNIENDQECL